MFQGTDNDSESGTEASPATGSAMSRPFSFRRARHAQEQSIQPAAKLMRKAKPGGRIVEILCRKVSVDAVAEDLHQSFSMNCPTLEFSPLLPACENLGYIRLYVVM